MQPRSWMWVDAMKEKKKYFSVEKTLTTSIKEKVTQSWMQMDAVPLLLEGKSMRTSGCSLLHKN